MNNNESVTEIPEVSISRATILDLETIQKLNQALCAKENREYDETINADYPFTEKGEEYFRSRIESADALVLVAKEGPDSVGYLVGAIIEPEDYRTIRTIAELENMFIVENYRGKGIGGKLSKQFEDWCKERKVQIIRYVASAQNIEAIKFYQAHGSKKVNITLEKELEVE
jgi:ribosomal protein S18 acetylase RimI-like enzyme